MLDRILNTVLHKWYGCTEKTCIVCRTMFDINNDYNGEKHSSGGVL